MANEFKRGLLDGGLAHLRLMPQWWRDLLDFRLDQRNGGASSLVFALRDGYFNVYAYGQSVLKVGFDARRHGDLRVRCAIHSKYVLGGNAGSDYLHFDGARVTRRGVGEPVQEYVGSDTLARWVEAASRYAAEEKKGVTEIAARHPNVIDVEMALPADATAASRQRKAANRMDIVALEKHATGYQLAFYEAKLFSNGELRARDNNPRVLKTQLVNYSRYVSQPERRLQIVAAYRETCRFITALNGMRGIETHPPIYDVASGATLELDPEPRLIVFGYRVEQAALGSPWTQHEAVLRNRAILIMAETARAIRLQQ